VITYTCQWVVVTDIFFIDGENLNLFVRCYFLCMSTEEELLVNFDISKYPTHFRSTQEKDQAYVNLRAAATGLSVKYQEVQVPACL